MRRISLNKDWKFQKLPGKSIHAPENGWDVDEADYAAVSLPHTWYRDEDQYRGLAVYEKTVSLPEERDHLFLEFEGADQHCKVYANGMLIGEHRGAYSRFRVKVPQKLAASGRLELKVFLSNEENDEISPLFGDFTVFGGLYRNVNLLVAGRCHFDYLYYGTDGIIVKTQVGESGDGIISVEPHVVCEAVCEAVYGADCGAACGGGGLAGGDGLVIRYEVLDAAGAIAAALDAPADQAVNIEVEAPVCWDGKEKPYLYTLRARLYEGQTVVDGGQTVVDEGQSVADEVRLPIGFRKLGLDPASGFYLNGRKLRLNGVAMHQDFGGVFSAAGREHLEKSFDLVREIGANAVRLSHYQHPQGAYDVCDREGYVVWAEIPMLKMTENEKVLENAKLHLTELILQNIHHPSICFWGIQNEIGMFKDAPFMHAMCRELYGLAKELDDTRLVTAANLNTVKFESELNRITDMVGYNLYFGWYYGEMEDYGGYLDRLHEACPVTPFGISEYGVDANPAIHTVHPVVRDYSEEYQAVYNETVYPILEKKEYLWGSFIWNMFDFSSSRRKEGGVDYINQKGLVTYDRSVRKDAFYYYKAKWSAEPFVHICSGRFEKRAAEQIDIKVYTNLKEVCLYDGEGSLLGTVENDGNGTAVFRGMRLWPGENRFRAVCLSEDGRILDDSVVFKRVEEPEKGYILSDSGAGQKVKNWFLREEDIEKEGYFSLRDSAYEICQSDEAMAVFCRFAPVTAEAVEKEEGIPLGLSLLNILGRDKARNPEFEMEELNRALNQVKKTGR